MVTLKLGQRVPATCGGANPGPWRGSKSRPLAGSKRFVLPRGGQSSSQPSQRLMPRASESRPLAGKRIPAPGGEANPGRWRMLSGLGVWSASPRSEQFGSAATQFLSTAVHQLHSPSRHPPSVVSLTARQLVSLAVRAVRLSARQPVSLAVRAVSLTVRQLDSPSAWQSGLRV